MIKINKDIEYLRSTNTIRERCQKILQMGVDGKLDNFSVDLSRLGDVAKYVVDVTKENYPDLDVPYHSRWQHFNTPGKNRLKLFKEQIAHLNPEDQGRALYDLVIVSVLLDAGAGMQWQYETNGETTTKSEGLAVASFEMFAAGLFSSDSSNPLQVDAKALIALTSSELAAGFQVTDTNLLVGLEGRTSLLNQLGAVLEKNPAFFGQSHRLGNLYSYIANKALAGKLKATVILDAVLNSLSDIWPSRIKIDGVSMGDVWHHSALDDLQTAQGLVPFHKLSQWLSYSLIEPLEWNEITVLDLDELTGLPEYRNGGLLLDLGLIALKSPDAGNLKHKPDSELIVEWRALTVALLDKIGDQVRQELGKSSQEFPLAKVLQGGTWAAGRKIAKQKRQDGGPPINLDSDGTVF